MMTLSNNQQEAIDIIRRVGFECIESVVCSLKSESEEVQAQIAEIFDKSRGKVDDAGEDRIMIHEMASVMMIRSKLLAHISEKYGCGPLGRLIIAERIRGLP